MRREKGERASGAVGKILQTEFTNGRMSPAISGALDRRTAGGLVVIHVDPLELKVGVAAVGTGGVDAVLIRDDLTFYKLTTKNILRKKNKRVVRFVL